MPFGACGAGVDKSINGSLNGRVPVAGWPRPKALRQESRAQAPA